MNSNKDSKKEIAISFLRLASSSKTQEAFDVYVEHGFRHHNPYFQGDAKSLAKGMEENAVKNPDKVFEVKHALEEGDFVAVHSRLRLTPGGPEMTVVHIFRFENNRIAE